VELIFHTLDLYFGEDSENVNRGLDVCDRVKADPRFAGRIKTLRLHWSYEDGDMLDLMERTLVLLKMSKLLMHYHVVTGLFRTALPAFIGLHEFEWIGYPEMRADMVQALLASHPHLQSLGLV